MLPVLQQLSVYVIGFLAKQQNCRQLSRFTSTKLALAKYFHGFQYLPLIGAHTVTFMGDYSTSYDCITINSP